MTQSFNYLFNIGGNFPSLISTITEATNKFNAKVEGVTTSFAKMSANVAVFGVLSENVDRAAAALTNLNKPGIALNSSLSDLSALTGLVGDDLKQIETYAREAATTFGVDAAAAVESYKMVLGQLSPELAKSPLALKIMGEHIATLSKLMGGDATSAAEALNTAMNQYGVDLSNPIEASRIMGEMMHVMAAASQEGSAEVPQIKAALEQAGMAAKSAGVSFEETNAAIQVLDKAGKKASEGGVALRNVMATLAQGRFLPKQVQEELKRAHIDVGKLTDKSFSLSERLRSLQPIMSDSALLSKLFGKENANAANALIGNIDLMDGYTRAITGTTSATDQASIVMQSYAERQARMRQRIEDVKVSLFETTGSLGLWTSVVAEAILPIAQLTPIITLLAASTRALIVQFVAFGTVLRAQAFPAFLGWLFNARLTMSVLNTQLSLGRVRALSFGYGMLQAGISVVRFATVGLLSGLKALGAFIISLVTGGASSATFSAIASTSFAAFKVSAVTACRAVSVAISSIPIIGWIALAITAIGALGVYLWSASAKFRAVIKGLCAYVAASWEGLWQLTKTVFGAIGDLIIAAFSFDGEGISKAIDRLKGGFAELGQKSAEAYQKAYDEEMERSEKDKPEDDGAALQKELSAMNGQGSKPMVKAPLLGTTLDTPTASQSSDGSGGGGSIRNITITIDKLVESIHIHTATMAEAPDRIKALVAEALMSAVNDVNLAN